MNGEELYSIGFLSQTFQRGPSELQKEFETIGVVPHFHLNDVPHYTRLDIEKMRRHLQSKDEKNERAGTDLP